MRTLIPVINFADYETGEVYARLERGKSVWRDAQRYAAMLKDPDAKATLPAVAPNVRDAAAAPATRSDLARQKAHTLGAWGEAAPPPKPLRNVCHAPAREVARFLKVPKFDSYVGALSARPFRWQTVLRPASIRCERSLAFACLHPRIHHGTSTPTILQLAAGAATLPAIPQLAWAQAYPTQPVRMVVGFPAGQAADSLARLVAQAAVDRLGQQFIVENRPGAGGNIGTEAVVRAQPDGYTILMEVMTSNAINASLYKNLNFNFVNDIAPVA